VCDSVNTLSFDYNGVRPRSAARVSQIRAVMEKCTDRLSISIFFFFFSYFTLIHQIRHKYISHAERSSTKLLTRNKNCEIENTSRTSVRAEENDSEVNREQHECGLSIPKVRLNCPVITTICRKREDRRIITRIRGIL